MDTNWKKISKNVLSNIFSYYDYTLFFTAQTQN